MRILKCHIANFGCYSDKIFDFSTNLNPFFLKNGEGKTTLAMFIKAMFYSLEKSSKSSYERTHYMPYVSGEYGGSIEIEIDGKCYRIERTFEKTPAKDTLKIYDKQGQLQDKFLNKNVSELQGDNSSMLGEMIFGIDAAAFTRCNFISSNDLDFSNSESIKMKIGNIIIDKDQENSYEETCKLINNDLRDTPPTKKAQENAYPYKIKELEKENKNNQNEINELDKDELELKELYEQRDNIRKELTEIELKQKEFSKMHVLKGKMTTVESLNNDINEKNNIIDNINKKYDNHIPSKEELNSLSQNIEKYRKCETLDESYKISLSDIERLKELENKVLSEDDYSVLVDANSKLINSENIVSFVEIDNEKFIALKARFENKNIKDEVELEKEYYDYNSNFIHINQFDFSSQIVNKDYPSENVLLQIESEIKEYIEEKNDLENFKFSYKEPNTFVKILLFLITFGVYFIVLKNKKKKYKESLDNKEKIVLDKEKYLNNFFDRYGISNGTFVLRLAELRDQIVKYEKSIEDNVEKEKLKDEAIKNIEQKKRELLSYFSFFGYMNSDVDEVYRTYKNDLKIYQSMINEDARNKQLKSELEDIKREQLSIIDNILNKYSIYKKEDFSSQLNEIKTNFDFFKKYNPIYLNKKANLSEKKKYEENIINLLKAHNINCENIDVILCSENLIEEINEYNAAKEVKTQLIEKREEFIKINDLRGFVLENIEDDEEKLREEYQQKSSELDTKEDAINQIEIRITRRDILNDEINKNLDLIKEYKEKIEIAKYAKKALDEAQGEMEAKFIAPIKNSFISYAKQIYEKMALNINMNYDYKIQYDVKRKLRDVDDLSDGERTIMMLALRFAVLDSMYKNHDSIIVLDDPFESLDDEKLAKAKELIKVLANDWQIVYFTCHNSRTIE